MRATLGFKSPIEGPIRLAKIRVSGLAALAAATGHILAAGGTSGGTIAAALGVFAMACGSCALNQLQEKRIDKLMRRTKGRPIPAGQVRPRSALLFALLCMTAGAAGLIAFAAPPAAALGLLAAALYNGLYTNLKPVTRYAAIPGGLVGAIPPAVGWTAAGGSLSDPRILALMLFMFVWQVPHFWLLLLNNSEDYELAGLPSVTGVFTPSQLGRVSFVWIAAAAVSPLMIPAPAGDQAVVLTLALGAAAVWLVLYSAKRLALVGSRALDREGLGSSAEAVYIRLNVFALFVLCSLSVVGTLSGIS